MLPYATIGSARIYHGKMQDVLQGVSDFPIIQTLITDSPYWGQAYAQSVKIATTVFDVDNEGQWQARLMEEYLTWFPLCQRAIEYAQGRAWFFGSPLHLPVLIRLAYCMGWPLQRIWFRAGCEGLIQFGRPIAEVHARAIESAFLDSSHPTRIDAPILDAILAASDPDGLVLDPFMGQGGTLVAGLKRGMSCCGIEKEQSDCEVAAEKLRRMVREQAA